MHAGGELVQSTTMATVYGGVDSVVPTINMSDVMNQGVIDKLQEPMESTITVLAATASAAGDDVGRNIYQDACQMFRVMLTDSTKLPTHCDGLVMLGVIFTTLHVHVIDLWFHPTTRSGEYGNTVTMADEECWAAVMSSTSSTSDVEQHAYFASTAMAVLLYS